MKLLVVICFLLTVPAVSFGFVPEGKAGVAQLSVKPETPEPIEISAYDNVIVVANAPKGSKLEIYSVVGIKVREIEMKESSGEYIVNIAKGYYIARIGETVRKIAIK